MIKIVIQHIPQFTRTRTNNKGPRSNRTAPKNLGKESSAFCRSLLGATPALEPYSLRDTQFTEMLQVQRNCLKRILIYLLSSGRRNALPGFCFEP